ncbi:MAG TPA: glycosyltransferase family 39 protein [Nitrososphaeraceae archaeon]
MKNELFRKFLRPELLVLIPLVLSAYTHLWNAAGFPSIHIDEAHYMRRVELVINGLGPQESALTGYPRTYDHPYFGQLFLGGILKLIGYPDLYYNKISIESIEVLHLIPRFVMGALAVLDTFLLYKIVDVRYNRRVALIAAVLFAVMPMTWIFRRVYLDTLLMPLLFSSILFALYSGNRNKVGDVRPNLVDKRILILLSGIFLGLAIYTKIPTFTLIPIVACIVYFNTKSARRVLMWIVPVLLIPLLWPLQAWVLGQTDLWSQWVLWQTDRNKPLERSLNSFFQIDPVITIAGIAGLVYTSLRKDFFPLIWVAPFLVFSYLIGYIQYFHLIVIFPAFCISSAVLLESIRLKLIERGRKIFSNIIIVAIPILGVIVTTMLITLNVNSNNFAIYASIADHLPNSGKATMIGSHWWDWNSYWITQFVLKKDHELIDPFFDPNFRNPVKTQKVLLEDDPIFNASLSHKIRGSNIMEIRKLYSNSKPVAEFVDNMTHNMPTYYPYNILHTMVENENHPQGKITIRTNY